MKNVLIVWELIPETTELYMVQVDNKEFEILKLFLSLKGVIFSRSEILSRVWEGDVVVLDRTIDVNITRLRKKIGDYGKHIVTRNGYGYGFEA